MDNEEKVNDLYVIRMISPDGGQRGYLFDSPDGIKVIIGGIAGDVTTFESFDKATKFIRDEKLERKGVKAYVVDFDSVIAEKPTGMITMSKEDLFYVENSEGEKLFFNSKTRQYYFKRGEIGYPLWKGKKDLVESLKSCDITNYIIKNMHKKI